MILSDDRINNRGKLRALERLISDRCLNSGRVYHIDGCWEVLEEVRNSHRIVPVGIRTRNRQWKVEGVHYESNICGALNYVIRLDTEAVQQGRGAVAAAQIKFKFAGMTGHRAILCGKSEPWTPLNLYMFGGVQKPTRLFASLVQLLVG